MLLAAGMVLVSCNSEQRPLGVEAPAWKEFVHPKAAMKVYKEANENSPYLQLIHEDNDGYGAAAYQWSDEMVPVLWAVGDTDVAGEYAAYPLLATEGDFYKVYVSDEWMGCFVGYIKKNDCDVVKPAELTTDVLQQVGKNSGRNDYIVSEGKQKGLCMSTYPAEFDELMFSVGQLSDNCIVYPEQKPIVLVYNTEQRGVTFVPNEEGEGYTLTYGESDTVKDTWIFDAGKLSQELTDSIFQYAKNEKADIAEVAYYIPDVSKDLLIHVYFADGEYYGAYQEAEPQPDGPVAKVGKGDLPKFDLRGPVKRVTMEMPFAMGPPTPVSYFDREGNLTQISRQQGPAEELIGPWDFKFNNEGQVTKFNYRYLTVGTFTEWFNTFNDHGDVIRLEESIESVTGKSSNFYTVEILERDAFGNWTKRAVKDEENGNTKTETRIIKYYK